MQRRTHWFSLAATLGMILGVSAAGQEAATQPALGVTTSAPWQARGPIQIAGVDWPTMARQLAEQTGARVRVSPTLLARSQLVSLRSQGQEPLEATVRRLAESYQARYRVEPVGRQWVITLVALDELLPGEVPPTPTPEPTAAPMALLNPTQPAEAMVTPTSSPPAPTAVPPATLTSTPAPAEPTVVVPLRSPTPLATMAAFPILPTTATATLSTVPTRTPWPTPTSPEMRPVQTPSPGPPLNHTPVLLMPSPTQSLPMATATATAPRTVPPRATSIAGEAATPRPTVPPQAVPSLTPVAIPAGAVSRPTERDPLETRMRLEGGRQSVGRYLEQVTSAAGLKLALDKDVQPDTVMDIQAEAAAVRDVLDHLAAVNGLAWRLEGQTVVVWLKN